MPVRATKRGAARTTLDADADVLVCGASFAGLAIARELAGSGARVLMLDRYEVGERQTSACAAPTEWLELMGLSASVLQTFGEIVTHTPLRSFRWPIPWTFSTFDYRALCALLREQGDATFETAKVEGRTGDVVHTDRGDVRAPLIVDALGWRRVLGTGPNVQPPRARLSRGLEVHPRVTDAPARDLELWLDPAYCRAGYGWSFPARDEVRVGIGSFEPRDHVKRGTLDLAAGVGVPAEGFQGNWIPHQIRPAVEDDVFFAGDSAGHCLPVTAEGIRPAFYFAIACGRELRRVVEGRQSRAQALERYGAFSEQHRWKYAWLLNGQHFAGRIIARPRATARVLGWMDRPRFVEWAFGHYRTITPPAFATGAGGRSARTAPPARGRAREPTTATAPAG